MSWILFLDLEYLVKFKLTVVLILPVGFLSKKLKELGIKHVLSTPYHAESQGVLERFHGTLKSALTKYALDKPNGWEEDIPYVLFAIRSSPNNSLGVSPFELVFGHNVRGPLEILKESWEGEKSEINQLEYFLDFKHRLKKITEWAQQNLIVEQSKMKSVYDKKAKVREFSVGDSVLVLLPIPGQFKAKFLGPGIVRRKCSGLNYEVEIPGRRKKYEVFHINLLKPYYTSDKSLLTVSKASVIEDEMNDLSRNDNLAHDFGGQRKNSKVLKNLESKSSLNKNKFKWNQNCQSAFEKLKCIISSRPVLKAPDYEKPFKLMVDASDIGVGAVLLQSHDNVDYPVSYFSRKLNDTQVKYSTIEKETLALVLALKHFEIYATAGSEPLKVLTDHNPLKYMSKFKDKNRRLRNWSLILQDFNIIIDHVRGKDNVIADALSRNC